MNKRLLSIVCIAMTAILMFCFVACDNTPVNTEPKIYTIQYADDSGVHQIKVIENRGYSLENIPQKFGYEFLGLYDAEVGGTQYVSSKGTSVSNFTDGTNLTLYPHFKAKEYKVVLDYQGSGVVGERQLIVPYGSDLPELPKNLTGEHKEFSGWYTKANCEGVQIADKYGNIPLVSVLNEANFDLSSGSVILYAGFEEEKVSVTCCFEAGMDTEQIQVPYGTSASDIIPETRVNGKAVLSWSKTQGGEIFIGKITGETVLYAVEYAPIIEFDANGGSSVKPVIARAGSAVELPTPVKDLSEFSHWEDSRGNVYSANTMPSSSCVLKAVWNGKLVFDANGGTAVKDVSANAGSRIELPVTSKSGYIFAGWYTDEGQQYTSTTMPVAGLNLKAGWYKGKSKEIVFLKEGASSGVFCNQNPIIAYSINFAEEISELDWVNHSYILQFDFHANIAHTSYTTSTQVYELYATKEHFHFYSQNNVSDVYKIGYNLLDHGKGYVNTNYVPCDFSTQLNISNGMLYIGLSSDKTFNGGYWQNNSQVGWGMTNFYVVVTYPDTTKLYL